MHGSSFAGSNRAFTLTFKPYELSLAPHHVHATRLRPSNKVIRTEARIGQRNGATTSRNSFLPQQLQQQQATAANLKTQWDQITSTALYKYFLWRKDAFRCGCQRSYAVRSTAFSKGGSILSANPAFALHLLCENLLEDPFSR